MAQKGVALLLLAHMMPLLLWRWSGKRDGVLNPASKDQSYVFEGITRVCMQCAYTCSMVLCVVWCVVWSVYVWMHTSMYMAHVH